MWCPRLHRFCFSCLLVFLISTALIAQSSRVPLVNHSQETPLAERGTRINAAASPSGTANALVLRFAPAVTYGSGGLYADSAVVADVDRDGKPDVIVLNICVTST